MPSAPCWPAPVRRFLPRLIQAWCGRKINPGKVFGKVLPSDQVTAVWNIFPRHRSPQRVTAGASAVAQQASRRGAPKGSCLAQMLARKPKMLVTVALANKIARIIWALLVKGGTYRTPAVAA